MITFLFDSLDSYDDFQIVSKSVDRPILPALTKREISVPGKQGTYDFGNGTYENRIITVDIRFVGASFNDLRLRARNIAAWLSQTTYKELIFSDEPDKFYLARIYDPVSLENFFRLGKATVQFECRPFAMSVVTSAEDVILDDDVPLDSDLILDSGDDYTIHL